MRVKSNEEGTTTNAPIRRAPDEEGLGMNFTMRTAPNVESTTLMS